MSEVKAKTSSKKHPKDDSNFEDDIEQLEQIIDQVESGEIGLEQCLEQYEKGMKLVKRCRKILDQAEKRIARLQPDDDGQLREVKDE
jgi:exodeoxyribonuclease VII small subunit